jgi:urease accessory protein
VNVGLTLDTALHGYAWAWCENQALIAVRALPLGHLEGQRMLRALADRIDPAVEVSGRIEDDAIGRTLPGFAMAGMFHETQYSRVFRS